MTKFYCDACGRELPCKQPTITAFVPISGGHKSLERIVLATDGKGDICDKCMWAAMKAKIEGPEESQ